MYTYWDSIPSHTDVLITHQPPYGIGDFIEYVVAPGIPFKKNKEHLGCQALKKRVADISPRAHIFGHIHGGAGMYRYGRTQMINAAILDDRYNLISNQPKLIEI